jgi:hypothetical protein
MSLSEVETPNGKSSSIMSTNATNECFYATGKPGTCKRCGAWIAASHRGLMRRPKPCLAVFPMRVPVPDLDKAKPIDGAIRRG